MEITDCRSISIQEVTMRKFTNLCPGLLLATAAQGAEVGRFDSLVCEVFNTYRGGTVTIEIVDGNLLVAREETFLGGPRVLTEAVTQERGVTEVYRGDFDLVKMPSVSYLGETISVRDLHWVAAGGGGRFVATVEAEAGEEIEAALAYCDIRR